MFSGIHSVRKRWQICKLRGELEKELQDTLHSMGYCKTGLLHRTLFVGVVVVVPENGSTVTAVNRDNTALNKRC